MSLLKKLAGQTALYGLSSILGRMINFLLVPFFTSQQVLSTKDFGAMTELYAYIAFFNILYVFGMETTYFRFATKQGLEEKTTYNNSLSSVFLFSISLSGIIILFSPFIADTLLYPGKESYFIWLALILALDAISAIPFARLRLEEKAGKFATIKIVNIFINVFFNFFFLIFCKKIYQGTLFPDLKDTVSTFYNPDLGVEYVFISNFIASLVALLLLSKSFLKFKLSINKAIIRPMLVYSIPLMFMGFAGMVDEMLSRIILKYMLPTGKHGKLSNLEALGVFGACYRLSMFMSIAVQAFRYAADPFFFSQASNKNAPEVYAKVMKWFVIVAAFIFVAIGANLSIVKYFLRSEIYWTGLMVVPVLLLANLFSGIYYNLSVWYKLTDKTQYGLYITLIGAAITIALNILLIPIWGYYGSAITTLLCYLTITIISLVLGQKYYPIPYNLISASFYIGLAALLVFLALIYPFGEGNLTSFAFQFLLMITYLTIVFISERKNFNFKKSK
jgi:O-antigen/teichoic acid export membrane protein